MQRRLLARHAQDDLVAFGARGHRSARDLLHDAAALAQALPAAPRGAQVPLVIRDDRYLLAVAILAAWAREYVVALPPELDRDAITSLADAPDSACVLHDTASGIPLQVAGVLGRAQHVPALDPTVWLGRALASRTYARDLANTLTPQGWGEDWLGQAAALAELMDLQPGQRCATSVGPSHPHGVVLGVLVPLLTGAAFLREPLPARELGAQLGVQRIDVLVSIPAHLPELLESATEHAAKVPRVISALGPLSSAVADRVNDGLGARVSDLSHAASRVPILHCSSAPATAVALDEASNARLSQLLRAQPGVRDVAVLRVGPASERRMCIALAGERLDLETLRAAIASENDETGARLELVTLREIRRDGIGRIQHNELLRRFGLRPDGMPVNFALQWGPSSAHEQAGSIEHRSSVHIPSDYAYFDGHFPGYPILAGAAQLNELVLPYVRRVRPDLRRLTQMSRLKFSGRIQPGETVDVVLTMRPGTGAVDFALRRGPILCSAGTLNFAAEDAA